jgi:hypothetical protein
MTYYSTERSCYVIQVDVHTRSELSNSASDISGRNLTKDFTKQKLQLGNKGVS